MHVPGLKVVAPSNTHDVKGRMIAAVRDDNPVIFMEHRLLYPTEAYVPEAPYEVLPGKARVTAPGDDVTLVGVSGMVLECLRTRELLADVGVSAEVIDPIWLTPLDVDTIATSVRRTRPGADQADPPDAVPRPLLTPPTAQDRGLYRVSP